ncbi:DNA translocase FtsK [Mycobacterium sp. E2699]|uniref:DNA translocase FtsK n=1 Tax=Mycobacterium sp. E2699 TaxID=1834137 RepID=UPI0018D3BB63|nr:DNA translocase FtsK [Mycobacterium sp. E2699]
MTELAARGGVRFAVFLDQELPEIGEIIATSDVTTAIDWRNDALTTDAIVIIGDLERDRAAGLAEVPVVSVNTIKVAIFDDLLTELRSQSAPQPAIRLIRSLQTWSQIKDLVGCADYCEAALPYDSGTPERIRKELWRLGLLPDDHDKAIDLNRLKANLQLVSQLRTMDASTRQRLIRLVATSGTETKGGDYAPLRLFAATGDNSHLRSLNFADVQAAVKASSGGRGEKKKQEGSSDSFNDLIDEFTNNEFDEDGFLAQVVDDASDDVAITVGSTEITDWVYDNLEGLDPLMSDPSASTTYAEQAGSIEEVPDEAPFAIPGLGETEWRDLTKIAEKLSILEMERAGRSVATCSQLIETIIELRAALDPFRRSLGSEGVRLFMGSPTVRGIATNLVTSWIDLWKSLEMLRDNLDKGDRVYVRTLAEQLASTDMRITVHRGTTNAYVLPLHPLFIEPRLRAAEEFLASPTDLSTMYDLVVGSLDPAVPSISVLVDGSAISLGYTGQFKGALHYARQPRQIDSADVTQSLKQLTSRFLNVHPYSKLSLAVGLLNPPIKTTKALLKWIADDVADRVSVTAFSSDANIEELRNAVAEAKEELVSGEIASRAFDFEVRELNDASDLPRVLADSEVVPHVMFMFDVADVKNSAQGAEFATPPLGSLISEWIFDTDPLEDSRPIIRPRSGSGLLSEFIEAQAGLLEMPIPTQQRSPLLSDKMSRTIAKLAEVCSWLVLCEGVSSLVPPLELGGARLVGRMPTATHVAFVYSSQIVLLVEPVLAYLQQTTWIAPNPESTVKFLLDAVRMALPEGLLGFFKARGALSKESVLGRLGLAAAVGYLADEDDSQLIVSLDTDGARRWLGLREGSDKRADLIVFRKGDDVWSVQPIEVKARTEADSASLANSSAVGEAIDQVRVMESLLRQVFGQESPEPFTTSRREILKRQVFLEALQQWEPIRVSLAGVYRERLKALNEVFESNNPGQIQIEPRLFVVSPTQSEAVEETDAQDESGSISVTALGVPWLKRALDQQPGSAVEIPSNLLDQLGAAVGGDAADTGPTDSALDEVTPTTSGGQRVAGAVVQETASGERPLESADRDEVETQAARLRDAFIARDVPFLRIDVEQVVQGPAVIQVPFVVKPGAKLASVQAQEEDLARDLGVQSVRIANLRGVPGYAVAELPRRSRVIPDVTTLRVPEGAAEYPMLALGVRSDFSPEWVSLDALPHLLVAGTTGSGKSVFLRSLLWQLTQLYWPEDIDLVLIDAKGLADYLDFSDAPQFRSSTDFHSGVSGALELFQEIVEKRLPERSATFRAYAQEALRRPTRVQVTNLRQLLADVENSEAEAPLRPLVVIIDEFAELVLSTADRRRFESLVTRFLQVARAVGGHLIAATQRPSTDVVTGLMKSNFSRVALRVQQSVDSRVILDENGAETLLGRGDLLFKSQETGLLRLQGFSAIGPYSTVVP